MSSKGLKMCRACRGLIAADATTCPLCGAEGHYAKRAPVSLSGLSGALSVNTLLILTNLLVYVLVLAYQSTIVGPPRMGHEMDALNPYGGVLDILGSAARRYVLSGQYWRLINACFLHGGIWHIAFNSYALFVAGRIAEEEYGGPKFLCVYLLTGIAGNLTVVLFSNNPAGAVGASGAICGLIGAMAVYGYKRGDIFGRNLKGMMVQWIIWIAIISFLPGVSLLGHLGGLVSGAAIGYFLTDATRTNDSLRTVRLWQAGAALCIILTGASFVLGAMNARKSVEIYRLGSLTGPMALTYAYYQSWPQVTDSDFDQYRQQFGSNVTTLENAEPLDEESASIRDHMLDLLHERRNQLHDATGVSDSSPDRSKVIEVGKIYAQYKDWVKRKCQSLGIDENEILPSGGRGDEDDSASPRS